MQIKRLSAAIILFSLAFSYLAASAQDVGPLPLSGDDATPQAVEDFSSAAATLTVNCYTSAQGCAGYTKAGPFNFDVGCSIWWNNGSSGRSNFTLRAGQTADYYVRYNDTGACVALQYAPPADQPRWYLFVYR